MGETGSKFEFINNEEILKDLRYLLDVNKFNEDNE